MKVRSARFAELRTAELYEILRLRNAVFVVEQRCPFADLDGHDTEPTTTHWWIDDTGGSVIATARLLRTQPGSRIGRVAVDAAHRGQGLATRVVEQALRVAPRPTRADVQAHLEEWYARLGFERDGAAFVADGIAHVPMVLG